MSIFIPSSPGIRTAAPRLLDWGGDLIPVLRGGVAQRLNRLGSRYALGIELPPMPSEPTGRLFLSKLRRAKKEGALYAFPQDGFKVGAPGAPRVMGAGQAGITLIIDGFTPYYAIREGQFFSLIHNGRRYLNAVAVKAFADAGGVASLTLEEMLRVSPADNSVCEFVRPMIEGSLAGDEVAWSLLTTPHTSVSFSITEIA